MKYLSFISVLVSAQSVFGVGPHAYITNQLGTSVNIIDVSNNTVQTIYGFTNPRVVHLNPEGTLAYVGSDDNTMRIIDTITNTLLPAVISVTHPIAFAITPDPQYLYVLSNDDTVSVIRTSDNMTIAVIPGFDGVQDIKINSDGTKAYVTNGGNGTVSVIDTATNTISNTILGFKAPVGLTFNDGTFAYVTDRQNNALYVIDTATDLISDIILGLNFPGYSAVSPNKDFIFISNPGSNSVQILRTSDNFLLANSIPIPGPRSIAVTEDGLFLYVGSELGSVFKVDLTDYSIVSVTPGFENPANIAVTENNTPGTTVNACQFFINPADIYNEITWENGPGMPIGFRIYRNVALTQLVASLPAGTTSYLDLNLEEGQSYSYFVLADYANGFSSTIGSVEVNPVRLCQ